MTMVLGPDKKAQAAAEKKRTSPEAPADAPTDLNSSATEAVATEAVAAEPATPEAVPPETTEAPDTTGA
jgi:hypothetical protein